MNFLCNGSSCTWVIIIIIILALIFFCGNDDDECGRGRSGGCGGCCG